MKNIFQPNSQQLVSSRKKVFQIIVTISSLLTIATIPSHAVTESVFIFLINDHEDYKSVEANSTCPPGIDEFWRNSGVVMDDMSREINPKSNDRHLFQIILGGYFVNYPYIRVKFKCRHHHVKKYFSVEIVYTNPYDGGYKSFNLLKRCHSTVYSRYMHFHYGVKRMPNLHGGIYHCPANIRKLLHGTALSGY